MTLSIEKLKNLQKSYKEGLQFEELLLLLKEIKNKPQYIFYSSIGNANDVLMILVNLLCHNEPLVDYENFVSIKSLILDILAESVKYPERAWHINESIGIISILFDEIHKPNEKQIYYKILECLDLYLKFERSELNVFGSCEGSCCNFGFKQKINQQKINSCCSSIVNFCLKEMTDFDGVGLSLIVLNNIYGLFSVHLSPDTCGNAKVYGSFKQFLLSVFDSSKYTSLCFVNALSCILNCRDSDSSKCFNNKNGEYTLNLIYDIVVNCERVDELAPSIYAISLLTDIIQQTFIVELIQRVWTINHFKNICKKLIGDYSATYYETILNFFLAVRDKIPEWNSCMYKFLHTNSKLFTFINKLTLHESDRCSILAWRLLKIYFKPSEINDSFVHEYLSIMINSIRWNLEKTFISDKSDDISKILMGRCHLRSVKRGLESYNFCQLLLDDDKLSDQLNNIFVSTKLFTFIVALSSDLMDPQRNSLLAMQPYNTESLGPYLCDSNSWFLSAARLVASLMFINVSMSQNYPDSICIKNFEPILRRESFGRLLALCITNSGDSDSIARCVALVTFCSHLSDYNIAMISEPIKVNNNFLSLTCRCLAVNGGDSSCAVDRTLSLLMSSTSLNDTHNCTKYHENVSKIVDSWISGQKTDFSSSETVLIFEDYIRSLKDHEKLLEQSLGEKDAYIRHCNDSIDQYRCKAVKSDVCVRRLTASVRSLNETIEGKSASISELTGVKKEYETKLCVAQNELVKKDGELSELEARLRDMGEKYSRASKDFEGLELLNNELRALLTKSESENKSKDLEIKRLKDITETIQNLFQR